MLEVGEFFIHAKYYRNDVAIDYYQLILDNGNGKCQINDVKREIYDYDRKIRVNLTMIQETHDGIYKNDNVKIRSYFDRRSYFNLIRYLDIVEIYSNDSNGVGVDGPNMERLCAEYILSIR